jgi:hypothetical protein
MIWRDRATHVTVVRSRSSKVIAELVLALAAGWCSVAVLLVVFDRETWRKPARV